MLNGILHFYNPRRAYRVDSTGGEIYMSEDDEVGVPINVYIYFKLSF